MARFASVLPSYPLARVACVLSLAMGALPGYALAAASYPSKPVSMIVPFPAGGATDAAARLVAGELGKVLGQNVIVENVAGASGSIAAQKATRAAPDGYTLLMGTVNDVVLAPAVNPSVTYTHRQLTPIGEVGVTSFFLVANPAFAASTIDEAAAYLKAHPDQVTLGIPGVGTLQHVAGEMLARQLGATWTSVPYKGAAPLMVDLLGGQIDLGIVTVPSAGQYVATNKLKSLGILSEIRDVTYPELPTINEGTSVKGLTADAWVGLFAPANVSEDIADTLHAALGKTLAAASVQQGMAALGFRVPAPESRAAFAQYVAQEDAKYHETAAALVGAR